MKKKFAVLVLALTMIFSMSSCGLEEIAGIGDYLQMLKGKPDRQQLQHSGVRQLRQPRFHRPW